MSALTATTELALATGAPIAVAMLNPRASHHLGVIGAGVVAGAFVGRMSVGVLLPPEGQTETNDAIGALLGGAARRTRGVLRGHARGASGGREGEEEDEAAMTSVYAISQRTGYDCDRGLLKPSSLP